MLNDHQEHRCPNDAVAELFHLRVSLCDMKAFFETSDTVHQHLSGLEGYAGMDVLLTSDETIMVLVRWTNYNLFDRNLSAILNAQPITAWLNQALSVAHQPAILKSFVGSQI